MLSLIITVTAYLLGDLFILPMATKAAHEATGNILAAIADFGLIFITVWALGRYFVTTNINWFTASLISAAIIAVGEILFHRMIRGFTIKQIQTE